MGWNVEDKTSEFLFARPSFIEGMARILDLGGTLQEYNKSRNAAEADAIALTNDARAIGNDLRRAVAEIAEEIAR